MSTPDQLLYVVSDSLGLDLNVMNEDGKEILRGFETRDVKIGPWTLKTDISVCSDVLDQTEASFFVRVTASLWLYLIVSEEHAPKIYVFDGNALGLKSKDTKTYGTGSVDGTLKKIGKVITAVFQYTGEVWVFVPEKIAKTA